MKWTIVILTMAVLVLGGMFVGSLVEPSDDHSSDDRWLEMDEPCCTDPCCAGYGAWTEAHTTRSPFHIIATYRVWDGDIAKQVIRVHRPCRLMVDYKGAMWVSSDDSTTCIQGAAKFTARPYEVSR